MSKPFEGDSMSKKAKTVRNQKEGVFFAVCSMFNAESFDKAIVLTKDERATLINTVTTSLVDGSISMTDDAREKYNTPESMRKYVDGLVSNWLRKDLRLNGNVPHEIKNPGSRAGNADPVIKELRKLRKTLSGEKEIAAVDKEINTRIAVVQASKAKSIEINVDMLPKELQHLAPKKEA